MIRPTLVLDLDGTLVDSAADLAAALSRLMAARGLAGFSRDEVAAMVGDGAAALLARAFAARAVAMDEGALAAFLADYGAHAAVLTRPYPGVPATLAALAGAGWRLAVCTNKPVAPARALLGALGLDGFFAAVGGGDSFAVRKPDPGHLLATIAASGGDPARAVMVGDHHNDLAAAQAAGVPAIFAAWGYGAAPDGDGVVATTFAAVPALAAGLLG